jgi:SagB-type dehydrogenase family enzyme
LGTEKPAGEALRKILLTRAATNKFSSRGITREQFLTIVRLAFRGGTFFPLHPDGPHVALVRPFWVIHDVAGFDAGVWYYNPPTDAWTLLTPGSFRRETAYLAMEQAAFSQCAAVCFPHCHLHHLMAVAGPDIYRLAHLEAGIVANRIALSTEALDLGWCETGSFYDDEVRQFLGLRITGWEPLSVLAVGHPLREADARHGDANAPAGGT